MLVSRASSLQQTEDANTAYVKVNKKQADALKLQGAEKVCIKQNDKTTVMSLVIDEGVADNNISIPSGLVETAGLGGAYGAITVEKI